MEKSQFKNFVEWVLKETGTYKPEAVKLLLGTAAQESAFCHYARQLGGGPALGFFQMEPFTFTDIIFNYLKFNPRLSNRIIDLANVKRFRSDDLEFNLVIQVAFARVHYLRVPEKLPDTIEGMAKYWKQYYNTPLGKGKPEEFVRNYKKFVL